MFIPTDALLEQIMLNEKLHAAGAFNGVLDLLDLVLFTNAPALSRTSVLADLTQPTYNGYAVVAGVVWGAVHQRLDRGWCADGPLESFAMADALTPTTLQGYGLYLPAGTLLYGAEYFPTPVSLINVLSLLQFVPQFCLGGQDWGQVTMVS